jgi:hypothetical protein
VETDKARGVNKRNDVIYVRWWKDHFRLPLLLKDIILPTSLMKDQTIPHVLGAWHSLTKHSPTKHSPAKRQAPSAKRCQAEYLLHHEGFFNPNTG